MCTLTNTLPFLTVEITQVNINSENVDDLRRINGRCYVIKRSNFNLQFIERTN